VTNINNDLKWYKNMDTNIDNNSSENQSKKANEIDEPCAYNRERYVRWQQRAISEMGKTINHFLTITIATLGFSVAYLLRDDFYLTDHTHKILVGLGVLLLVLNTGVLLFLIHNRQQDLRLTSQKVGLKKKEKCDNKSHAEDISYLTSKTKDLGNRTWTLYNLSLIIFFIAEILIVVGFACQIVNIQSEQQQEYRITTPLTENMPYDWSI
jgi:hypothetical protein